MFRKRKNNKAQNTAEYAILIALVIGAVVAMQTYAQRALQGRIHDASGQYLVQETVDAGFTDATKQYEPYYLCTASTTERNADDRFSSSGATTGSNVTTTGKNDITANTDSAD